MSFHYSRALVAAYSEASSADGEPSAPSKSIPTAALYCASDKMTEYSRLSRSGMILEPLTESLGEELLMSFLAAFPVRTFQVQEKEKELVENKVDCGMKCVESFAKYDQDSASWKTAHYSLFGGLTKYLGTWPRWGTMQNGECLERTKSDSLTNVNVSGLLPTPLKGEGIGWKRTSKKNPRQSIINILNGGHQFQLIYIPLWNHSSPKQATELVELMMDWPLRWTDLPESAMAKFQQWLQKHGMSCVQKLNKNKI